MKILIDADACPNPVLHICLRLGLKYGIQVWTVASFNHHVVSDHHIVVGDDSQEADLKVMNLTESGDIVVTQDWGLAAMVLGKAAKALSPVGREFRPESINFLLEEREAKAKVRRSGGRTKGPRKRTDEDNESFARCLDEILNQASGMDEA
ncbi:hypothetical protein CEB3_c12820 [Peptococcaceae bacterium CEB3]|nr:hypothetical protein CEB3_c12820 [Peptococcaceae bacterium CEB3]